MVTVAAVPLIAQTPRAASQKTWSRHTRQMVSRTCREVVQPHHHAFERPAELGSKAVLTEKEAAELEARAAQARVDGPPKGAIPAVTIRRGSIREPRSYPRGRLRWWSTRPTVKFR